MDKRGEWLKKSGYDRENSNTTTTIMSSTSNPHLWSVNELSITPLFARVPAF
jgi:hypothetical protein